MTKAVKSNVFERMDIQEFLEKVQDEIQEADTDLLMEIYEKLTGDKVEIAEDGESVLVPLDVVAA